MADKNLSCNQKDTNTCEVKGKLATIIITQDDEGNMRLSIEKLSTSFVVANSVCVAASGNTACSVVIKSLD